MGVDLVDPTLMGHWIDREYIVCVQSTSGAYGWVSNTSSKSEKDKERDAPRIDEALRNDSNQRHERVAHISTRHKLSWYEMIELDNSQDRGEAS